MGMFVDFRKVGGRVWWIPDRQGYYKHVQRRGLERVGAQRAGEATC